MQKCTECFYTFFQVTVTDYDNDRKNQEDTAEIYMETDDELEDFDINTATIESQKEVSPIKKYVCNVMLNAEVY